jgi:uncharacterized membrane protein
MGDPYKPPVVDVSPPDVRYEDSIQVFEKFSTWYVIGLSLITLGLYPVYWLISRSRRLNRLKYIEPVSEAFMQITAAAWVLSYPISIGEIFMRGNATYLIFSQAFEIVTVIVLLVWAFMFRNRLNTFLERSSAKYSRLGPVMTFFFQVFYLSFKVNQNLDLAEAPVEESAEQEEAE